MLENIVTALGSKMSIIDLDFVGYVYKLFWVRMHSILLHLLFLTLVFK